MLGTLFLIPTTLSHTTTIQKSFPLYNIEILSQISGFIVENARTARQFLSQCGIKNIQELNIYEIDRNNFSFDQIKKFTEPLFAGKDMAIMSENGCPCVADPGSLFVRFLHEKDIKITPLIGPSSIILALMASGLNGQNFCFHGYLPINKEERDKKLKTITKNINIHNTTAIFIETPYRNNNLFQQLLITLSNDFSLCIATDINGEKENIRTKHIFEWKREKIEIVKLPTIFLLGR